MKTKIAYSVKNNIAEAVEDLKSKLNDTKAKMILYFASSNFESGSLAAEMNKAFKDTKTVGCTTSGELVSGMMLKDSIVAMCFSEDVIEDFEIAAVKNLSSGINLQPAITKFEKKFGNKFSSLEHDKYFGIVLIDGLCRQEENFMDELGNHSDVIFIGGAAGDDLKFKATYLFEGNEAFSDGAILILIKSKNKFGFIKTQSFKVLDKTLLPTKVDEQNREVIEFNNKSAVEFYAGLTNVKKEDVQSSFMKNPVGLVINGEPYVRSPQAVNNGSLKFYCNIKEGVELNLLESTDIIGDTEKAIKNFIKENGNISAIINFNCILRTLELEGNGKSEEYGKLFSNIPTVGFSTYGEEFIGHINQTATMLVFV